MKGAVGPPISAGFFKLEIFANKLDNVNFIFNRRDVGHKLLIYNNPNPRIIMGNLPSVV